MRPEFLTERAQFRKVGRSRDRILASNEQKSPAASIFALRYDDPTLRLPLCASSLLFIRWT